MRQPLLIVNQRPHPAPADGDTPLLWWLRDSLGLTGTKYGCGVGACGACTVHVDRQARRACVTPCSAVDGEIVTIEHAVTTPLGRRVLAAWLAEDVAQCGYCQPGQIMGAMALLAREPRPQANRIVEGMNGHLCRCGTYGRIQRAIARAAREGST